MTLALGARVISPIGVASPIGVRQVGALYAGHALGPRLSCFQREYHSDGRFYAKNIFRQEACFYSPKGPNLYWEGAMFFS